MANILFLRFLYVFIFFILTILSLKLL